jgi:membrane-associated protein
LIADLVDFILHVDKHLLEFVATYGAWVYGLVFAIIFAETGLVVTPFLPGDSLLFATGALCATGVLNLWLALALLSTAAFSGNLVNYLIGRAIGPRVLGTDGRPGISDRLLKREHVLRTQAFFAQYGGKAVILARFLPIVRTLMPFVAGAAQMRPQSFLLYTFAGALGWVVLCLGAGFVFGNVPIVKNNFSLVTIGIVIVSLLPMAVEYFRHRRGRYSPR